jgi:hypothetical protein
MLHRQPAEAQAAADHCCRHVAYPETLRLE